MLDDRSGDSGRLGDARQVVADRVPSGVIEPIDVARTGADLDEVVG